MIVHNITEEFETELFLSEVSEKDKCWDYYKARSSQTALLYRDTRHQRYYERMLKCADRLLTELHLSQDATALKVKEVWFCRVRHCPACQWRRVRMWIGKFLNALPAIMKDYPSARFLHLTLTVRNCDPTELRATLADMNRAWQRLTQRKQFKPVLGFVKAVEFTRNSDKSSPWYDSVHPHFHALLMVRPGYFTKNYVSHDDWVKLWRDCLKVDYDPSVRVQAIKPKNKLPDPMPDIDLSLHEPEQQYRPIMQAVCEVVKYAIKPDDLAIGGEWVLTLTDQLHGTRAISVGGVLKAYLSEPDEDSEELITAGLEPVDTVVGDVPSAIVLFGWREQAQKYRAISS